MNSHPVATSAATGSLSTLLLWFARDLSRAEFPAPSPLDFSCPSFDSDLSFWKGVATGFAIWPILEALLLVKQWLVLVVRNKLFNQWGESCTGLFDEPSAWHW